MFGMKLLRLFLWFTAAVLLMSTLSARCGVERWSVKTGTDDDVSQVDLTTPTPTSVATLIGLTAPHPIPKKTRVQGPETTLWMVTATLTGYKIEDDPTTGDSDYHLVLMDPSGNTMIAEIPSPECVDSMSVFASGIMHARSQFDSRFTPVGHIQNVSVPVRVTGVGMFDFAHGQTGRADNGIELHPVLDIAFLDSGTPPTTPPTMPTGPSTGTQIIGNPSFESGAANPAPWTASSAVIDNSTAEPAHSGTWKAWLGGYGQKHTDKLSQKVTIPAGVSSAFLSFWLRIESDETTTTKAFDTLDVQIVDSAGQTNTLETFSNLDVSAYHKRQFDLSDFAGQTVTIMLTVREDAAKQTSFIVDDFALVVQ